MKILHLTPTFLPTIGGAEIFIDQLCRAQISLGHNVAVAVMRRNTEEYFTGYPVFPVYQSRFRKADSWLSKVKFANVAREFKADIIHCHYGYPTGMLVPELDVNWTVTSHGGDLYYNSHHRAKKYHWSAIKRCYTSANAIISISPFVSKVLEEEFKIRKSIIHYVPNGIDTQPFLTPVPAPDIPAPYILFMGRLAKVKNTKLLIEAFSLLKRDDLHLAIAGYGPEKTMLENLVSELGLTDRISFLGKVVGTSKSRLFQHALAVALPSFEEACPIVAIESIASGTPLLTSDIVAFKPFTESHDSHHSLGIDTPKIWASALDQLREPTTAIREEIRGSSKRFDIENVALQHIEIYQKTG